MECWSNGDGAVWKSCAPILPSSELEHLVEGSALRATRAVHVGIVGIDEGAFLAPENIVFARFRFKAFSAIFVVNRHPPKAPRRMNTLSKNHLTGVMGKAGQLRRWWPASPA